MPANRVKCPQCGGKGSLRERVKDSKTGKEKDRFRYCKKCKGSGYIVKNSRWSPRK